MKTIKIRFVKNQRGNYNIQEKGWFGRWKYIGYSVDMGYGGYYEYYSGKSKQELLDEVSDKHFRTCRKYIKFIQYPTIKIY